MIYPFHCLSCSEETEVSIPMNDYNQQVSKEGILLTQPCPKCGNYTLKRVFQTNNSINIPDYMKAGPEGDTYTTIRSRMSRAHGFTGKRHYF